MSGIGTLSADQLSHRVATLAPEPTGRWRTGRFPGPLLVCAIVMTLLMTHAVSPAGAAPILRFVGKVTDGIGIFPEGINLTSDGRFVYVPHRGGAAVAAYSRDGATGALTWIETHNDAGAGLWRGDLSPDDRHVYFGGLDGAGGGRVVAYAVDQVTGALTFLEAQVNGIGPNTGLAGTASVVVSPDGKHVYSAASGALPATGGTSTVAGFARDDDPFSPSFGRLTFLESIPAPTPTTDPSIYARLIISPDGKHLYVTAYEDNSVSIFSRHATTGLLTYVGHVKEGENGIVGFNRPAGMALSPDGAFFYVASWGDGVITTLKRNASTGQLAFSEVEPLVGGFAQPAELEGGVGGTRLFGSAWDRFVSVSLADPGSGALTRKEQHQGAAGGDPGLEDVLGTVAPGVSPDGKHLYVTLTGSPSGIAVFAISCGDGVIDPGESCDDGNSANGDGCTSDCEVEECWTCTAPGPNGCAGLPAGTSCASDDNVCRGDVCDGAGQCVHPAVTDGVPCNDQVACTAGDECRSGECRGTAPTCGDGTLTPGCEQCDDGNLIDGDGCAADCSLFEKTVAATLDAYGTLTTDTEADGATPASPIELAVTTPNAGYVSIHLSGGQPLASPDNLGFFGTRIDVEAPENIAAGDGATSGTTPESRPLVFVYTIDASLIPSGVDATTIEIPRNGVSAPPCQDSSGSAVPDPCVFDRATLPGGDVQVTVLSTHASKWNLAAPPAAPPGACSATPALNCEPALRSKLDIRNDSNDARDKLLFTYAGGAAATSPSVFADPTGATPYTLCIYDQTGLKSSLTIAPGSAWAANTRGYKFKGGPGVSPIRKVLLKSGSPGKTKLLLKGKGPDLPDAIGTAMNGAVTVQLHNGTNGNCWQDGYSTPLVSNTTRYKGQR